jgi:hypothetical protein
MKGRFYRIFQNLYIGNSSVKIFLFSQKNPVAILYPTWYNNNIEKEMW